MLFFLMLCISGTVFQEYINYSVTGCMEFTGSMQCVMLQQVMVVFANLSMLELWHEKMEQLNYKEMQKIKKVMLELINSDIQGQ